MGYILTNNDKYKGRILVVDDDIQVLDLLKYYLEAEGFRVQTANSIYQMKQILKAYLFDGVLLDIFLGEDNGFDAMAYLVKEFPLTKVIVMTAHERVDLAVSAMEKGALTFVPKSQGVKNIVEILKQKLATKIAVESPAATLAQKMGFVGESLAVQQIITKIEQLKDIDATVLIVGETGTGKELVARALHDFSKRKAQRYEAINCSAIPDTLLEAELFGYKKGAFTDAKTDRIGLFQICSDGTLFLDEIGDMPITLQPKVLRVLQEKELRPIGSNVSVKVNTRVVAATHKNLFLEVEQKRFREDLLYRLSVFVIEIPPLRDRVEDIPILIQHFVDKFSKEYQKEIKPISRYLLDRLKAYSWPGNVRELKNAIERSVVLSQDGNLHIEDILPHINNKNVASNDFSNILPLSLNEAKKAFEQQYIIQLLKAADGNISEAARLAGKHRTEIYRLIEKYNIDHTRFRNNNNNIY